MGNILHNNRDLFHFRLNKDEYWDFCLSNDNGLSNSSGLTTECLIAYIDITNEACIGENELISLEDYIWEDAVSNGITLNYIGYTGVDNGYIFYEKDKISNKEFYELFKHSTLEINENDYTLKLNRVKGNNQIYDYECEIVEENGVTVSKLNGGFYQGFFETNCDEYKILPDEIEDGWNFEIVLKKQDFDKDATTYTLNDKYPDNKGIFLYIGTRAENKWWTLYTVETEFEKTNYIYSDSDYFNEEYMNDNNVSSNYLNRVNKEINLQDKGWIKDYVNDSYWEEECDEMYQNGYINKNSDSFDDECRNDNSNSTQYNYYLNTYQNDTTWYQALKENFNGQIYQDNNTVYCKDDYINYEYFETECNSVECENYVTDDYISDEFQIDEDEIFYTSEGYAFDNLGIVEYETDNKFMFFDRTCDGYNAYNWKPEDGEDVLITDIKTPNDLENYFLLFDRTCDGYNIDNIQTLIDEKNKEYSVLNDIFKNALAFQITDNGEIGYKYLVQDCDSEELEYKIESEFTSENIISSDEWHVINIKIIPKNKSLIERDKTMQISIYVDGKLRLQSQELPMLKLKQLNDNYDKQQGVPYNISLGGGTQGLCDVIYLDYYNLPEYVLPIEKEFGGSFIGLIKSFKMYNCPMSFNEILSNYNFEMTLI